MHSKYITSKEREVLELIASGMINKEIAEKMKITPSTLKNYRSRILIKLEANSIAHAVAILCEYKTKVVKGV